MYLELCPLNGNCQAENIVHEATITYNLQFYGEDIYIGIAEITFKKRYSNHKRPFNLIAYKNYTDLSKKFQKIKRSNSVPQIMWKMLRTFSRFNRSSFRCNLCLKEKLEIALFKETSFLIENRANFKMLTHKKTHSLSCDMMPKTKSDRFTWIQ